MSDAQVANPEVEVKEWTAAEKKAFEKKHKPYREAAAEVNGFIDFLKEQHSVADNEGWQLGDGCFVRRAAVAKVDAPAPPATVNRTQEKERRAKKKVAAERVAKAAKAVARELVHPNGVPVGDVAL